MLKMKRMTMLVVVALGLVALAAPTVASAGTSKKTHEDIKRLGNNVAELRKKTDEMNNTIASLASVAGSSLTQLKDGLTTLADTTANFKYGVMQVQPRAAAVNGGLGPAFFVATPPLYYTGASGSVTIQVPTGLGALSLYTAVRSYKPDTGSVGCKVTAAGNGVFWYTNKQGVPTADNPFYINMPQGDLTPNNGSKDFPLQLTPTYDDVLDLGDGQYGGLQTIGGGLARAQYNPATSGANVTLTCIRTS